jgi:hypothetical protein
MEDGRVTFEWKDYADGGQTKTMTLEAVELFAADSLAVDFDLGRLWLSMSRRMTQP